ncbi:MAG: hypothetical protein H6667_18405 [Ardenticatenaceae bacterium]|nr:hypothetical protein [Ardenticatenaceae bacterium]MCB9445756.1 hypothetical protein [Ardenticatenaceae bacterium]
MKTNLIESYLHDLERELRRNGSFSVETLTEIESHLLESVERGLRDGLSLENAELDAIRRFGPVHVISTTFEMGRISPMQKLLLTVAAVLGLLVTYVDSRPTWDDTGITAVAILFVCGLVAFISYKRPWLFALAVGAWIPLYGILFTHNYGSILTLIIAFIGAYGGWVFRLGINKMMDSA